MDEKEFEVTITVRVAADTKDQARIKAAYAIARGESIVGAEVRQIGPQVFQD